MTLIVFTVHRLHIPTGIETEFEVELESFEALYQKLNEWNAAPNASIWKYWS